MVAIGVNVIIQEEVQEVKKLVAICTAAVFFCTLGIAFAEDESTMPWQQNKQTTSTTTKDKNKEKERKKKEKEKKKKEKEKAAKKKEKKATK